MDDWKLPYGMDGIIVALKERFGDELAGRHITEIALATALLVEPVIRRQAMEEVVSALEASENETCRVVGTALRSELNPPEQEEDDGNADQP